MHGQLHAFSLRKNLWCQLTKRLGESQNWFGHSAEKKKTVALPEIEPHTIRAVT